MILLEMRFLIRFPNWFIGLCKVEEILSCSVHYKNKNKKSTRKTEGLQNK